MPDLTRIDRVCSCLAGKCRHTAEYLAAGLLPVCPWHAARRFDGRTTATTHPTTPRRAA